MRKTFNLSVFMSIVLISCVQKTHQQNNDMQAMKITTDNETIRTGSFPIQTLEDSGIIVNPAAYSYSLQFVYNKEYNNEIIPIALYATFSDSDSLGKMDSLVFVYNHIKQCVWLIDRDLHLFHPLDIMKCDIEISDYNFDNYLDIGIYNAEASGVKNTLYEVFLYDPETKNYYYHKELSGMSCLFANKEKKTISTFEQGGMASMLFGFSEYKWEKDKLVPIYLVNQTYNESLGIFIRNTNTLQNNVWVTQIDSLMEDEAREIPW